MSQSGHKICPQCKNDVSVSLNFSHRNCTYAKVSIQNILQIWCKWQHHLHIYLLLYQEMEYWYIEIIPFIILHFHIRTYQFIPNIYMYIFTQVKYTTSISLFPQKYHIYSCDRRIQRYMHIFKSKICTWTK